MGAHVCVCVDRFGKPTAEDEMGILLKGFVPNNTKRIVMCGWAAKVLSDWSKQINRR